MNFLDVFTKTLTNQKINTAIISSIAIILLGYFLRKKGVFNDSIGKVLTSVVLTVSLPALAFNSFLVDINEKSLKQGLNVLIWGILVYIVLIIISKPLFMQFKGDQQDTMRVLSIFGSTTFFGIPIVTAIYGPTGTLYASIFNIGYRIFLYSYGYIKMSGLKMTMKNVKTIFIWLFQGSLPQVAVSTVKDGQTVVKEYAFLRLDQTLPQFKQILTYLSSLASPLAWLAIGATLGSVSFKDALSNKPTWYYTAVKLIVIPAINIVILAVLAVTHVLPVDITALGTIVVMMATPPATVAAAYAISFDKDAVLASNASLLGTLGAVILTPVWIVIVQIIGSLGIFH